jgi:hypothetical protein
MICLTEIWKLKKKCFSNCGRNLRIHPFYISQKSFFFSKYGWNRILFYFLLLWALVHHNRSVKNDFRIKIVSHLRNSTVKDWTFNGCCIHSHIIITFLLSVPCYKKPVLIRLSSMLVLFYGVRTLLYNRKRRKGQRTYWIKTKLLTRTDNLIDINYLLRYDWQNPVDEVKYDMLNTIEFVDLGSACRHFVGKLLLLQFYVVFLYSALYNLLVFHYTNVWANGWNKWDFSRKGILKW